jgi:hypothetical protein
MTILVYDLWKIHQSLAFQGDDFYSGDNLGPVAMISFYVKEDKKASKDIRRETEKEEAENGKGNTYPSYEELKAENEQDKPMIVFTIKDSNGTVVRKMSQKISAGFHRMEWDLRYASKDAISLTKPSFYNPFAGKSEGSLVTPGRYSVEMSTYIDGEFSAILGSQSFDVIPLNNTVLPAMDRGQKVAFQRDVFELSRKIQGAQNLISEMDNKMKHIRKAIKLVESPLPGLTADANEVDKQLREIKRKLNGDRDKTTLDIGQIPTPADRIGWIEYEQKYSTSGVTKTHRDSYTIAKEEFEPILNSIRKLAENEMNTLEQKLEDAGAPYTPGRALKMIQKN